MNTNEENFSHQCAFRLFDKDQKGEVTIDTVASVLRNLGFYPTMNELQNEIDTNHDGRFSLNEFISKYQERLTDEQEERELKAAFKVFNRSGSGYITEIDLRSVLNSLGEYLTNDEIEDMIEEVDLDGDGRIDYAEFVASLRPEQRKNSEPEIEYISRL